MLPQDLGGAQALITELLQQIEARQQQVDDKQQKIERLEHMLYLLRRHVFGRRSEKAAPAVAEQGTLPFAAAAGEVAPAASDENTTSEAVEVRSHKRKAHPGRKPLPADLPVEIVEIEPADEDLICACCEQKKVRIGADTTQALDYRPASFFIREYVRSKYACASCQQGVTQAMLPARPIDKGRPEPGVLAHVVSSKYADHLPLYRIEQIFGRHGIEVSRGLLSQWNGAVADLLTPLATAVHRQVLESRWIQSDDTKVKVREADRVYRNGHMWVYRGECGDQVYDFDWVRNKASPSRLLAGYRGYLQGDAAPAFDDIFASHAAIIEVGCWAHARRYFKDAELTAAAEAKQIVLWIGELYGLEKRAKENGMSEAQRLELRQQKARPILKRIKARLEELRGHALPKSPLAEAITYACNQWAALERYTEHGALEIDNNGAERAIKPIVIGRKNWMHIGNEAAAKRTAVLLTLVNTCKAYHINPFEYLRDVIERVSTHPMSRIAELTPRIWKQLRQVQTPASQVA
jgi:transposase